MNNMHIIQSLNGNKTQPVHIITVSTAVQAQHLSQDKSHSTILNEQHLSIVFRSIRLFLLTIKQKSIPSGSLRTMTVALAPKNQVFKVLHAPWVFNSFKQIKDTMNATWLRYEEVWSNQHFH